MKKKKRYNKFIAYLLMDFSTFVLLLPVGLIMLFTEQKAIGSELVMAGIISILPTILLTLYINSRTPKGERVGTWIRAYWLGLRIAFKIALFCTLILIPKMLSWQIDISPEDLTIDSEDSDHWYNERGKVRDNAGNEYKVGRSGEYVQDKKGNWQKVNRDDNGDPYIGSGSDREYLK